MLRKLEQLGEKEFCETLGVTPQTIKTWLRANNPINPSFATAQKALNLWSKEAKEQEETSSESAVVSYEDGIMNMSYCPPEWDKKKAAWEGRDVCLCIPTYGEIPEASFVSFMGMVMYYRQALRLEHRGSDSMIARSRNQLAKRFLRTGATWSIWLDSDMIFPIGNTGMFNTQTGMNLPTQFGDIRVIERLISHGRTVVGGCYWDRRGSGRLIAGGKDPILNPIPSNNLVAVNFVGTGCLAVHRDVYLAIAEKYPETYQDDGLGNETGFFMPMMTEAPESRMMGEDEAFQWRATQAGHPAYLDLAIACGHVGTAIHGIPASGSKI